MNKPLTVPMPPSSRLTPASRITAFYIFVGALWVPVTDQLLAISVNDTATLSFIQTIKGWAFILVTAAMLYLLIRRSMLLRRSQQALWEEHAQLSAVLENTSDAVFLKDLQGRYRMINPAGARFLDKSVEEVIGKDDSELLSLATAQALQAEDRLVITSGEPRTSEAIITTTTGTRIYSSTKTPYRDPAGRIIGVFGIARDISKRKEAEAAAQQTQDELERRVKARTTELEAANAALLAQISERQRAEAEIDRLNRTLKQRLDELQTLLDVAPVGIAVAQDPKARLISINPAGAAMLGIERHDNASKSGSEAGRLPFKIFRDGRELAPDELPMQYAMTHDVAIRDLELNVVHNDGRILTLFEYASPLHDEQGKVRGCLGVFVDITRRKRTEEALRASEERFRILASHAPVGIFMADAQGNCVLVNECWCKMTGLSPEQAQGSGWSAAIHPEDKERCLAEWRAATTAGRKFALEYRYLTPTGTVTWLYGSAIALHNPMGQVTGYLGTVVDITERKAYESRLRYQANYDGLTQLPNRTLLQDRLEHAIAHAQRIRHVMAVLFLDLDRFKTVNDSLGHAAGDALLKAVAARLTTCVREGDTVARLGGDEFVIVLEELPQADLATLLACKVLEVMKAHFTLAGQEFFVNCSIGISLFPKDGQDGPTLLKNADTAMYRAKERGRNMIQFYAAEMNARAFERLTLENGLRHALEAGELMLHYQPQVDLASSQIIGMEALLRWRHLKLGMIAPAEFIPLAEATGLIVPIGEWVLKTACAQIRAWQEAGLPALTVAVNLSTRQFMQAGLTDKIAEILTETGLDAHYLELEITESLLMQDVQGAIDIMRTLKARGVKLAIDDFGTGYSSLTYLKRFPVDRLKIDQSFVRDITTDPDDAAITQAVIAMAHSLRLKVIAEGVETEAQLAFLRSRDCNEAQGFHFSRPLPPDEATAWLLSNAM